MDLDPRLVRGSSSSASTIDSSQDHDHLQLTLGVIEAAVHRTVRKLLSGSSATSSGSHRTIPTSFGFNDGDVGISFSDSELYAYREEEVFVKRRMKRRRRSGRGRESPEGGVGRGEMSGVKEDFVRSVAVLSGESTVPAVRRGSLDLGETKSDGRCVCVCVCVCVRACVCVCVCVCVCGCVCV